jgi:hypothetical protein
LIELAWLKPDLRGIGTCAFVPDTIGCEEYMAENEFEVREDWIMNKYKITFTGSYVTEAKSTSDASEQFTKLFGDTIREFGIEIASLEIDLKED